MGWTNLYRTPGLTDRAFFESDFFSQGDQRILDCTTVRNVFYAAVENAKTGQVYALVVLVRRTRGKRGNFWYKAMDETVGPVESECPERILDLLSPPENDWATEWRKRCRANAAAKKAKGTIRKGETVQFAAPANLKALGPLTKVDGRKGLFRDTDGRLRRITWWRSAQWEPMQQEVSP